MENSGERRANNCATAGAISEGIEEIGSKVKKLAQNTSEHLVTAGEKIASEATGKGKEYLSAMETYVKDHPVQSSLIAAFAGFLLGRKCLSK